MKDLGVERRVKVTIPSPSHLELFYPNPKNPFILPYFRPVIIEAHERVKSYYPSVDEYLDELKPIIINEAEAAFKAGANVVQFDSPDISSLKSAFLERAVEVNNSVISHFPPEKMELHICWGNYENTQVNTTGCFKDMLPAIYDLKVGTLGPLEIFDGIRDHKEIKIFKEFPPKPSQRICAGIVSVKTRNVEPVEVLKERYEMLMETVGPERAAASPGCGIASAGASRIISLESARRKLINLVKAVKEARKGLQ